MSSRQKPLPYVIFHSPCLDGFGAAFAAWKKFGCDGARYVPLNHNDALPQIRAGADVYLLDISFKRADMLRLCEQVGPLGAVYILDHHITAQEELRDIEQEATNLHVTFDMEHSGAYLAWYFFHPSGTMPLVLRHVEDRDLWKHSLIGTEEVVASLATYEQDFSVWEGLLLQPLCYSILLTEGRALLRAEESQIAALLNEVRAATFELPDARRVLVPTVNAPFFLASEIGHELLLKYPNASFAAVYRDTGSGRRDWSLRSEDSRTSVGDIAKLGYGGGGHRNAAGFSEERAGLKVAFVTGSYDDATKGMP